MCDSHAFDRRSLLRAGAGVVTVGALATFAPAAAGAVRTKTFRGEFTSPATPDWHYLPIKVPRGVREIEVSYDFQPDRHAGSGFSYNVVDIGIFDPSGHELGNAKGFRGWSGGAATQLPDLPRVGDARLPRRADHAGRLARRARPLRDRAARHSVARSRSRSRFGDPGPRFEPRRPRRRCRARGRAGTAATCTCTPSTPTASGRSRRWSPRPARPGSTSSAPPTTTPSSRRAPGGGTRRRDFLIINGEEVTTRSGHWLAIGLPAGTWIDWRYRAGDHQLPRFTDQVRAAAGWRSRRTRSHRCRLRWEFGYD